MNNIRGRLPNGLYIYIFVVEKDKLFCTLYKACFKE